MTDEIAAAATLAAVASSEDGKDEGSSFCPCINPTYRKIGYYLTYGLGMLFFLFGTIKIISVVFKAEESEAPVYLIAGSLFIILNPLWIKNCKEMLTDMKNPARITSFILFVLSNVGLIVFFFIIKIAILMIVFTACVVMSGIWYFLSFFPGAQNSCLVCMKNCCCSGSKESGGEKA